MSKWFDEGKKVIVFGSHERKDVLHENVKEVECSICGFSMYINQGMYPGPDMEFNIPPPEKWDLALAKECMVDLVEVMLTASRAAKKYLKGN